LTKSDIQKFKKDAVNILSTTINYLDDWYDYDGAPFKLFSALNLKKMSKLPTADVRKITETINLVVDEDKLFDELHVVEQSVKSIKDLQNKAVDMDRNL
jgi:hypothetical protein